MSRLQCLRHHQCLRPHTALLTRPTIVVAAHKSYLGPKAGCCCGVYAMQTHPVVGAYMEFVERKPLPEHQALAQKGELKEIHRRDGFEAASAKNIFASTTLAASQMQKGPVR